jgi:hypothetical protein
MLDAFLNITPFDAPAEPTEEQAAADLATEAAAAAAWRLKQRYARGSSDGSAAAAAGSSSDAAVGAAGGQPSPAAANTSAAAAAAAAAAADGQGQGLGAEDGGGVAAAIRRLGIQEYRDRVQRWQQWGLAGWSSEDYLLGMQQWLLHKYSSKDDVRVMSSAAAGDESSGCAAASIQRMSLCVGEWLIRFD